MLNHQHFASWILGLIFVTWPHHEGCFHLTLTLQITYSALHSNCVCCILKAGDRKRKVKQTCCLQGSPVFLPQPRVWGQHSTEHFSKGTHNSPTPRTLLRAHRIRSGSLQLYWSSNCKYRISGFWDQRKEKRPSGDLGDLCNTDQVVAIFCPWPHCF